MKRLDLRLPDELHARLVELAEREHRTLNAQLVHGLTDHVEREQAARGEYDNQLRRRGLARQAADEGR
jgi:predicted transcriptional regulator